MKMNDYIKIINSKLEEYIPLEYPHSLYKAMKYTLMLPGKRLRPVMCLETCSMLGGNIEDAIPSACAVEMLHCETLIKDDLPSMDNDDYRRGQLANHKVFGEAISLMAADALLVYAPQIILKYSNNLTDTQKINILNEYFEYSGAKGVIAGQVVDIESENNEKIINKEETLNYLHLHKTSDLFKLAMRTGAIVANADEEKMNKITEFAQIFGLAFQICDDILDETSTFSQLGKSLGKDREEGKLTYVSLYGIEKAKCKLSCLLKDCCDIIEKQDLKSEIFHQIIEQIGRRAGI